MGLVSALAQMASQLIAEQTRVSTLIFSAPEPNDSARAHGRLCGLLSFHPRALFFLGLDGLGRVVVLVFGGEHKRGLARIVDEVNVGSGF